MKPKERVKKRNLVLASGKKWIQNGPYKGYTVETDIAILGTGLM
jgi:CRISPR/Cas system-associated endoribonuclease Cas2